MDKAIVLLSGGLDSAVTMAVAKDAGHEVTALSFQYGQRHVWELECARRIAETSGTRHVVVNLDLRAIGGSALTSNAPVPKGRDHEAMASGIPVTYVPARNTIFLSYALALAEVMGATTIFLGVNALDYSGYPDCRPEYVKAFERMANLATRAGVEGRGIQIGAPILNRSKAQIIRMGQDMGVDFSMTSSCYDPTTEGRACGQCDSCRIRRAGFIEAGVTDPTRYV